MFGSKKFTEVQDTGGGNASENVGRQAGWQDSLRTLNVGDFERQAGLPTFYVDDPACLLTIYVGNPACLPTVREGLNITRKKVNIGS